MSSTPTRTAGLNVRAEMTRKGITQTQIAEAMGVSQAAVSARLRGATPFTIDDLARIASYLDVPLERLTEGVAA